jgi:hypothetical protein
MKGVETFYFEIYIPFYVYLQQYLMWKGFRPFTNISQMIILMWKMTLKWEVYWTNLLNTVKNFTHKNNSTI